MNFDYLFIYEFTSGLSPVFIVNVYGTSIGHYKKYGGKQTILFSFVELSTGAI